MTLGVTQAGVGARGQLGAAGPAQPVRRALTDAVGLALAQVAARVLSFFGVAAALRMLGPEKVGVGAELLSLTPLLALVWDLGIDVRGAQAVAAAPKEERLQILVSVMTTRLLLGLGLGIVGVGVMIVLRGGDLPGTASLALTFLCAVLATASSALTLQWFHQGNDSLKAWSWIQLGTSGASCLLYLLLVFRIPKVETYLVALAATNLFSLAGSLWYVRRTLGGRWRGGPSATGLAWLRRVAAQARDNAPLVAINGIGAIMSIDVLYVALTFGEHVAGGYRAAMTMNNAVTGFVAILPAVLTARIVDWSKAGSGVSVARQLGAVLRWVAPLLLVGAAAAVLWSDVTVRLVLGAKFANAAGPFALMALINLLNCLCLIFAAALNFAGREKLVMHTALVGCGLFVATTLLTRGFAGELAPLLGKGVCHACMAVVYTMAVFGAKRG